MKMNKIWWAEMTWEEVKEAAEEGRVAVLPVGAVEQHGLHLPVDTDAFLVTSVINEAAKYFQKMVVCPTLPYGNSTHHLSYPGTISLGLHTFIEAVAEIVLCLGRHGFRKILLLNGHGGNRGPLNAAARLAQDRSPAPLLLALANYYGFGARAVQAEVRESERGGMAHACEYETSLYLHFRPELVRMDRAQRRIPVSPIPEYIHADLMGDSPIALVVSEREPVAAARDYTFSPSGVAGDPTLASAEKGRKILERVVEDLVRFLTRFQAMDAPA